MGLGKLNPVKAAKKAVGEVKKAGSGLTSGIKSLGRSVDRNLTQKVVRPVNDALKQTENYYAHGGMENMLRKAGNDLNREVFRPAVKYGIEEPFKRGVQWGIKDPLARGAKVLGAIGGALGLSGGGGGGGGVPSLPGSGSGTSTPSLTNPEYQTPLDLTASGLMDSITKRGRTSTLVAGLNGFEEDDANLRKNLLGR